MGILDTCIRIIRHKSKETIWYRLEILVVCMLNENEKAIEWIKSKIQEDKKFEQNVKNRCSK